MKYQFPNIETIDDVLAAFDEKLFYKAEKQNYTVINYHCISGDTFPDVTDEISAIRREFRGLIFDEAGNLIRRPFQKFFNVGEKAETRLENIDVSQPHVILDKLDGSMIGFFRVGMTEIWGTKMGETEISHIVKDFVNQSSTNYREFANDLVSDGYTPIFEWMSRKNRIVIDYEQDQLVLTAIRHMVTGNYVNIHNFSI